MSAMPESLLVSVPVTVEASIMFKEPLSPVISIDVATVSGWSPVVIKGLATILRRVVVFESPALKASEPANDNKK